MNHHDKELITGGYLAMLALRGDVIAGLILGFIVAPSVTLLLVGAFVAVLVAVYLCAAVLWGWRLGAGALASPVRLLRERRARIDDARYAAKRRALGYDLPR